MQALLAITDPYENRGWKFLAMIVGPSGSLIVLAFAIWTSMRFIRVRRYALAMWCLTLGALAVASWWGLAPLARRWSGWGDPDGDGVIGDFTNGAYDRVDVYGGLWGLLVLVSAGVCAAALLVTRTRDRLRRKDR